MRNNYNTMPYLVLPVLASLGLVACQKKAAPPAMPPQEVGVVTVQPQSTTVETVLPGRTSAYEIAEVRPQVGGVLQKRMFEQGADVVAGQQLYQIDPSLYQAAYDADQATLQRAQASVLTAKAKLRRYGPLAAAHAVSGQDYDDALAAEREAEADVSQAKANLESAATNLRYTKLLAPISGRIGRSISTVGALVTANQTDYIAVVTRLDPIYVDVNMASNDLLRLREEFESGRLQRADGNAATVTLVLEDGTKYKQSGKLEFSEVNVDQATASVVVRAIFSNADHLLLPGMYVHASILEGTDPNSFVVPQQAVLRDTQGEPEVMLVGADNKVSIVPITTSTTMGANWIVTKGLKAGDRIIVNGIQKARQGAVVKPSEVKPDAGKAG